MGPPTLQELQSRRPFEGIFGDSVLGSDPEPELLATRSFDQLTHQLRHYAASNPAISLKSIGTSNGGREIWLVSIGNGETDVLFAGQQHGNEPTGCTSLVALIHHLATGACDSYLESVTVHVVPRMNPDGAESNARTNVDPDVPSSNAGATGEGFFVSESGWDLNRYHFPDWTQSRLYEHHPETYPANPVPESHALTELVAALDPTWFVDVHNQGEGKKTPSGEDITHSIVWPILGSQQLPTEGLTLSKQLCVRIFDQLNQYHSPVVSRYPATASYPGVAHKAYSLQNRGSILYETVMTPSHAQYRRQALTTLTTLLSLVGATASGELYEIDPTRTDEIPPVA
ncbi:M14 family zinc carboxypeptidase [Haladaptatus sp. DYSN1]|uniref:M14 family zinc carboxypeptidase n=1 Tax=unclassified Haladaptatus TaxID=2622732 RepID=UPI002406DE3E|nr:M14 family zinc carboxypeptidase [Haladaptatus sp. DYSN1]